MRNDDCVFVGFDGSKADSNAVRYYSGAGMKDPNLRLGKITIRTIETVHGWRGQILVDDKPVWESSAFEEGSPDADENVSSREVVHNEARVRVANTLGALFA